MIACAGDSGCMQQARRYRCKRPLAVFAVAWTALAQPAGAQGSTLTGEDRTRLASGDVLITVTAEPQSVVARVDAAIDIPAPPSRVWSIMLDCARAPKFVSGLVGCRVIERAPSGAWDVREHLISWISLLPQIRSVFRSDYVPERSIMFRRTAGDIDVMEGTWQLEPLRGGAATRLRYNARIGKETFVPAAIIRGAIESDVPRTLRRLREEVAGGRT